MLPTREDIAPQVRQKLAAVCHVPLNKIHDPDTRLFEDLGMGPKIRAAIAFTYSRMILKEYPKTAKPVPIGKAGDLKTVGESIDLVTASARGGD